MILAQVDPIAFKLFGIPIHWYALIIVSGIVLGVWMASREAVRVGFEEDDIIDFMLWALPMSIIGARLYYVIFEWRTYIEHPLQILIFVMAGLPYTEA